MEARMELEQFSTLAPGVRSALQAINKAVVEQGLEKALTELIKLRASQINGCAFCLQFHLALAREAKISEIKLDLLAAWRESGVFTSREVAALAWTEALTCVTPAGVSDEIYAHVRKEFSEGELALLTSSVVVINAWNRIAIAFRFTPPVP
ncbi:MAG: carboxymuconolactone decarboxylase family protein [Acidobacteriota bacterium]|nr:carboxymuconolactone decarboxylase family protein [Acidobacteriota bacterium]